MVVAGTVVWYLETRPVTMISASIVDADSDQSHWVEQWHWWLLMVDKPMLVVVVVVVVVVEIVVVVVAALALQSWMESSQ
jgi:hypothetical protein